MAKQNKKQRVSYSEQIGKWANDNIIETMPFASIAAIAFFLILLFIGCAPDAVSDPITSFVSSYYGNFFIIWLVLTEVVFIFVMACNKKGKNETTHEHIIQGKLVSAAIALALLTWAVIIGFSLWLLIIILKAVFPALGYIIAFLFLNWIVYKIFGKK